MDFFSFRAASLSIPFFLKFQKIQNLVVSNISSKMFKIFNTFLF